ncbi:MAG: hypothetical protein B7Y15_04650 [Bacteroidetes bacterium 24-39-8]|jgi:hypothetical protein|nr:MAG: hypothetical protein B7Y76_09140 [Sphingobacteriia bacterium 35-40-5]OYZ51790.1 MAG: hypothetical protein B7Y15_04650 [Bacteroidetes bacterium 24-39-8]OZA64383.1 MAG: hypothetical protein B7X72_08955 [Sphingobacteriia bacterium 39-39-8]HQR93078.1 hypothetical protein [Sediminibacterium sp.]HQS54626.1 hypothetical protein [Sediminibacterium sp.]
MERVGTLIDKLKEQFVQEAGADNMLLTVQMLFSELQERASNTHGRGAVSVMMPGSRISAKEATSSSKPKNNLKKAELSGWLFQMELDIPDPLEQAAVNMELEPLKEENMVEDPIHQTQDLLDLNIAEVAIVEEPLPEQALLKEMYELNDLHADQGLALNEQLKTEKQELANNFQDTPIVDLKKAIGVNDRYLFINELFRGDETMFERSLKTINSFAIFPEAHYWIQRELKVKLGWNERSEIVGHFDQLVKRRFA